MTEPTVQIEAVFSAPGDATYQELQQGEGPKRVILTRSQSHKLINLVERDKHLFDGKMSDREAAEHAERELGFPVSSNNMASIRRDPELTDFSWKPKQQREEKETLEVRAEDFALLARSIVELIGELGFKPNQNLLQVLNRYR